MADDLDLPDRLARVIEQVAVPKHRAQLTAISRILVEQRDRARRRADEAEAELARRIEHDERMTELAADHVAEYAQRAVEAEEWAGQLYTAWWSARIGRARARTAAQAWWDNCLVIGGERDQYKATLARVREVVADMRAMNGMQGWVVTLTAALYQPEEPPATCICHPAKKPSYACRIHGRAAALDKPEGA